ncbi:MAG: hypothetical protein R3E74_04485 [Pseudomonadales bacterium]
MKTKIFIVSLVVISFLLIKSLFPTLDISPEDIEADINTALRPGDSAETIEEYLHSKYLGASYDGFSSRYQGIIRHPDSNFHAIIFHIYVDENNKFIRAEANDSYTFL